MTRKDKILSNLKEYEYIKKYLGKAIRDRLEIRGYTRGILTAHLYDGESSKVDLTRLERILQLGEKYCNNFGYIFKERQLPNKDIAIDGEIINTLAEVKAFEVLYSNHFEDLKKIKPTQEKTVDFTAIREDQNYAVEVMRFGLTQSQKKEPKYLVNIESSKFTIQLINGQDNIPIFRNIIRYAIQKKFPQIKGFCERQQGQWQGILLLSIGRDYFIVNKYANNPFNLTPRSTLYALKSEYDSIIQNTQYEHLKHVVITIGKDLNKAIVHPPLLKEQI